MKKISILFVFLLGIVLVACSPSKTDHAKKAIEAASPALSYYEVDRKNTNIRVFEDMQYYYVSFTFKHQDFDEFDTVIQVQKDSFTAEKDQVSALYRLRQSVAKQAVEIIYQEHNVKEIGFTEY